MFWENFLANFLSDILIVALFGGGTYLLFRKKINQKINQIADNIQNIIAQKIEKINGDKIIQKGERNIMIKETEKSSTDTPKLTKKVTEYYEQH